MARYSFIVEATLTVRSVGASGVIWGAVSFETLLLSTYARRFDSSSYNPVDTTAAVVVGLICGAGEGGATIRVDQFNVDISD